MQIRIEMGADGRPSGEALAEFITEVEAERAMAFDKQMMGNRFSFPPWRVCFHRAHVDSTCECGRVQVC